MNDYKPDDMEIRINDEVVETPPPHPLLDPSHIKKPNEVAPENALEAYALSAVRALAKDGQHETWSLTLHWPPHTDPERPGAYCIGTVRSRGMAGEAWLSIDKEASP